MKRLLISLALAISITVGIAGSAAAALPDNHACDATSGTPGLAAIVAHAGGCEAHAP